MLNIPHVSEQGLWDEHGDAIYRYLLSMTGKKELAEDLAQDTFLRAIKALRKSNCELDNEKAWLFRIATNLCLDHFRRRQLIKWLPLKSDSYVHSKGDISDTMATQDLIAQVLQSLSPDASSVLLLRDVHGFSPREIAEMLGQSYPAVRKRLARARESFRKEYVRLKGEGK